MRKRTQLIYDWAWPEEASDNRLMLFWLVHKLVYFSYYMVCTTRSPFLFALWAGCPHCLCFMVDISLIQHQFTHCYKYESWLDRLMNIRSKHEHWENEHSLFTTKRDQEKHWLLLFWLVHKLVDFFVLHGLRFKLTLLFALWYQCICFIINVFRPTIHLLIITSTKFEKMKHD